MKIGKQNIQTRSIFLFLYFAFVVFLTWGSGLGFLTFWLIGWVVVSHLVGEAAERKNRNYPTFLFLSILVSPLLMGIIVAVMANPDKK
jgi:hypothetical protein